VFICVTNYIDSRELWVEEDFEMAATGVKGRDTKFTWEIIGIYRAPKLHLSYGKISSLNWLYRNFYKA